MDTSEHVAAELAQAERHVREAEARIARQAAIVEKLRRQGTDTTAAQALLDQMNAVLVNFYRHLWRESQELSGGMRWVQSRPGSFDPAAVEDAGGGTSSPSSNE